MSGNRVLVTGARGFLGRHLTAELRRRDRTVLAVDVTPGPSAAAGDAGVSHVIGDVRDEAAVDAWVAASDLVIHLASIVGVDEYLARPDEVLDVGISGARAVLSACARHGRPVVLASTSEVYGKNTDDLREDADAVIGPIDRARWSYAIAKLAAEQWAHALARRGLRHVTVRYFNVYGDGLDSPGHGRVLAKMIGAVQRGEPIALVDGGEAVRAFCHVDDAVEATLRLAESIERDGRLAGRTFNVARREPVTIRAFGELVARLTGHRAGIVDVPASEAFAAGFEEIPRRVPEVDALREAVGFTADISLEEGLRRTLAAYGLLAADASARPREPEPVPWVRPIFDPDAALLARMRRSLESGRVTNGGPLAQRLEREAARWLGVDDAVAVSNGTAALTVSALALGLRGRFVAPAFTYAATISALELLGLEPVVCDVDPATWTLSVDALGELLGRERFAAVVAVNAFGVPPDLGSIGRICRETRTPLVYDDAHGFGTVDRGHRVPSEPDVTTFSLHATKVLPGVEGGLVVARDARLAAEVRRLRTHGLAPDPLDSTPGPNAKLDELRAAVALHGLARIDESLRRRTEYASRLRRRAEAGAPALRIQQIPRRVESSHQNFSLVLDTAAPDVPGLIARLAERGVEARRYFYPALHQLRRFAARRPSLPITERIAARVLSLPLHARMREADLARVEAAIGDLAEAIR